MRHIIRYRWLIVSLWILVTGALFFLSPNLQDLVAEKGQITVPEGYSSQEAQKLLSQMDENGSSSSAVLVFHEESGLADDDMIEISQAIDVLKDDQDELGISNILDFNDDPVIEEQTVSEDRTTILVPFDMSTENQTVNEARNNIYQSVQHVSVDHHLTGEQFIEQDIVTNSEEGLQKTIYITVVLILIILFVVFKSFVAPLIPLITIGISYLASQGIVAWLADIVNFPLSTFTQIFMVAVMFGIGTDYCILLISRFKEEMNRQESIEEAVVVTYKSGGKTILYAGLAVLIGFSAIGLSTFSLYQSAVAVAIGIAVVLIALATLVPFFLVVLGKKLFWPFDKNVEHKESKIWGTAGTFAWMRPVFALVIVAIITVPAILSYGNEKSYDPLAEIGDQYGSVIAFNWIADSFGPGQVMPTTVVVETDRPVHSTNDFQDIERMTQELAKLEGVDHVRSATRPTGEVIEDFLIDNQTQLLAEGIGQSLDGIQAIQDGIEEATDGLKDAPEELNEAKDGVDQLMEGTHATREGLEEISQALTQIEEGIWSGTAGAKEIKENLQFIKSNLDDTIDGYKEVLSGYQAITQGIAELESELNIEDLEDDFAYFENAIVEITQTLMDAQESLDLMYQVGIESNPELAQENDPFTQSYVATAGRMQGVIEGINEMANGLEELKSYAQTSPQLLNEHIISPLNQLNEAFGDIIAGQEELSHGITQLIDGIEELEAGLGQAAKGQEEVNDHFPSILAGLSDIYGGQGELKAAFSEIQNQLGDLSDGLTEMNDGLGEINDGLAEVEGYLDDIDFDPSQPIVVIPDEALNNEDFLEGIEPYVSKDRTITTFEVVLENSPYSLEAIELINAIEQRINDHKHDTIFEHSDPKIGGISSTNNDLQNISDADYTRTSILMVAGIFIILVILLKSVIMPFYLIGSLMLTYFTSMALTELIFVNMLEYDGLTWAVPFFAFVMLTALGIDYSIFLMDRFNEDKNGGVKEALLSAMKNMGTVIISAAVILGGTFAAMLPSGVLSLLQIATAVITGLFLYAFIMLPLFTPVMVRLFGRLNWWPFTRT